MQHMLRYCLHQHLALHKYNQNTKQSDVVFWLEAETYLFSYFWYDVIVTISTYTKQRAKLKYLRCLANIFRKMVEITWTWLREAGCHKVCMPKNTKQLLKYLMFLMLALSCDFLSVPLFLRLCVCSPGGGGLRGRIPDARRDQAKSSQQEVPVFFSSLPALSLWAGHAPGTAAVLCDWPRFHRADTWPGWHRHGDGWFRVSQLPVSGIYP